jgi:hypothetical protein
MVVTPDFVVLTEQRDRYQRQIEFMRYELAYGRLRAEVANDTRAFNDVLKARIDFLVESLNNAEDYADGFFSSFEEADQQQMVRLESSLLWLAPILDHIAHAVVQRRWKSSRARASTDSHPHVPLSEAHPAYANFYRAVQNTVCESVAQLAPGYFTNLEFPRLSPMSLVPLPVVSSGREFTLRTLGLLIPGRDGGYEEYAKRLFLMTYLTVPRYAPATLAIVPMVAHECFHFVVHILNFMKSRLAKETGRDEVELTIDDKAEKQISSEYGPHYVRLLKLYTTFIKTYVKYLSDAIAGEGPELIRTVVARRGWTKTEVGDAARLGMGELLCDVAATIMAGPAYVRAYLKSMLIVNGFWLPQEEDGEHDIPTHPPFPVRAHFQLTTLELLGFREAAAELRASLAAMLDSYPAKLKPFLSAHDPWLAQVGDELARLVEHLLKSICATPGVTESRDLGAMSRDRPYVDVFQEAEWATLLGGLAARVREGKTDLGTAFGCHDAINAMWIGSRKHEGGRADRTLPWLLALSRCQIDQPSVV